MAENLVAFDKIGCLPRSLQLSLLDEGQGIQATFRLHSAKWHDSCRAKYNKTKLQRAEKRKMPGDGDPVPHKSSRLTSSEHGFSTKCFFVANMKKVMICVMHQHLVSMIV